MNTVYFAGGCFWCMVKPFDSYPGIHGIKSGFMGGHVINPTYLQVKEGTTGHLEVVKIDYDEHIFSFEKLLDIFFSQIDPTDDGGQFMDRGAQYRTAVFYTEAYQAEQSLNYIKHIQSNYNQPIVTDVRPAETFYMAEEEHQDFYKKQPERYKQEQEDRKNYIETQKNLS